ncbi:3-dehydroquinate synthase [Dunaliella salina]|uniref:3-dehydroquinate synthase n=1 Tax=Dunaliella salina TaxID=3046 RepID=A0ABQ7H3D4_DUNSA|nr:3-dehydroquinate synthase [Dunaliella salina]|eukprot:KAF5841376.1 3-dehydroquinate synthase [Dunaliella salina]
MALSGRVASTAQSISHHHSAREAPITLPASFSGPAAPCSRRAPCQTPTHASPSAAHQRQGCGPCTLLLPPAGQRRGARTTAAAAAPAAEASMLQQQEELVMKTVDVSLGTRSYPIYIGNGLLQHRPELFRKHIPGKKVLVVTNENIAKIYLDKTVQALTGGDSQLSVESVVLPDGEDFKTLDDVARVWDKALQSRMDRGTTFLALGGGVVGDMCGFAAACYQRGVHFIQVPTTVMAQVDSSVGGKTGVNHPLGKNMIGAFYQPRAVLCDTDTLTTLPDRELASGISEIVKYGLIRDAPLFAWLEENMEKLMARDTVATAYAIERSCINKAEVVAADERETNDLRATLNLGHTFGHAIETGTGYGTLLHGEAVGWIDRSILDRTRTLLQRARLPVTVPPEMSVDLFKSLMAVDKKVSAGKLRLILLKGPLGSCVVTGDFDTAKLDETLQHFCSGDAKYSV